VHGGVKESGGAKEGSGMARRCPIRSGMTTTNQPVGDVDVVGQVFGGGVLLKNGADGDVEIRVAGQLLGPVVESVDVGEGDDLPAGEDGQAVGVELRFAAGGEPEVAGHEAGADDGGLLGLDQGDGLAGVGRQEVFAEEALGQRPVAWQLTGLLHQGVDPGDAAGDVGVFDAVAGLRVVLHHFAGSAAALGIELEEDGVSPAGDSEAVFVDEAFDDHGIQESPEEGDEGGVAVGAYAPGDEVFRDEAEILRLRLRMTGRGLSMNAAVRLTPVAAGLLVRVVVVVLAWGVVVVAAGFVVTTADGLVQGLPCFIDIEGETALASASWTSMAGGDPAILLQGIHYEKMLASTVSILSLPSRPGAVDTDLMRAAILPTRDLLMPRMPAISR